MSSLKDDARFPLDLPDPGLWHSRVNHSTTTSKPGLLLINLGTPDAPTTAAVRRFLREFLSDPKVIDIHPLARFLLLNLIILPFRSSRSAHAYRAIWGDDGSPLLTHGLGLRDRLRERLVPIPVELGMRYGSPGIAPALRALAAAGCDRIVAFPLYPQCAESTTGSTIAAVDQLAEELFDREAMAYVPPFYAQAGFIQAFAAVGRPLIRSFRPDHILFSYHGLPESHLRAADQTGKHCLATDDCCATIVEANASCYRAHCLATTRRLALELELDPRFHSLSFQSRLGRAVWTGPATTEVLPKLAGEGVKRLLVFCPSFVADCLETLEEIALQADRLFREAGGEALELVPSLNTHPAWIDAVAGLAAPLLRPPGPNT